MKKVFIFFAFLLLLCAFSYAVYFLTKDWPIYDRFYSPQEVSARDIQRIRHSLPQRIGDYTLQPFQKSPDLIQAYEGCYDAKSEPTTNDVAALCEREIIAHYHNSSNNQEVTVDFLSITKGLDEYISRANLSFSTSTLDGEVVFRFRGETDNEVLWYPTEKRNPILERLGWYPAEKFTSISVQQFKVIPLPDGGVNNDYTEIIHIPNPIVSYFLEKYPPEK